MKYKSLFVAIVSTMVVVNYGVADSSVTSRTYVDAQDALRQNQIPAAGVNILQEIGDGVVTYTNTAGTIGERGIFDYTNSNHFSNHTVAAGHDTDMITAAAYGYLEGLFSGTQDDVSTVSGTVSGMAIPDFGNLNRVTGTYKTCAEYIPNAAQTDENCILWNLGEKTVLGCAANSNTCATGGECCTGYCSSGTCACVPNGTAANTASSCCSGSCVFEIGTGACKCTCKFAGASCTSDSQCCDGDCHVDITTGTKICYAACKGSGERCTANSQCCVGLTCGIKGKCVTSGRI